MDVGVISMRSRGGASVEPDEGRMGIVCRFGLCGSGENGLRRASATEAIMAGGYCCDEQQWRWTRLSRVNSRTALRWHPAMPVVSAALCRLPYHRRCAIALPRCPSVRQRSSRCRVPVYGANWWAVRIAEEHAIWMGCGEPSRLDVSTARDLILAQSPGADARGEKMGGHFGASLWVRELLRAGKELLSCSTCEWSMVERAGSSKLSERLSRECPVVPLKLSGFPNQTHDSRRAVQCSVVQCGGV
jgi:hypothetical protein